jgi:hypothetical protein
MQYALLCHKLMNKWLEQYGTNIWIPSSTKHEEVEGFLIISNQTSTQYALQCIDIYLRRRVGLWPDLSPWSWQENRRLGVQGCHRGDGSASRRSIERHCGHLYHQNVRNILCFAYIQYCIDAKSVNYSLQMGDASKPRSKWGWNLRMLCRVDSGLRKSSRFLIYGTIWDSRPS